MHAENTMIKVGRVLKTFGKNGQLRCQIQEEFDSLFKKGSFIWLEVDGLNVPFLITHFIRQHKPLIRFANVTTEYEANLLSGSWIYLNRDDYKKRDWPQMDTPELEYAIIDGYRVYFSNDARVGVINQIRQYPGQEMAFVILDGMQEKEILVPLVDEFILSINHSEKTIEFAVPEGFFAL